jgi:hypothetical protein
MPATVKTQTHSDFPIRQSIHTVSLAAITSYAAGGVSLTFDGVAVAIGVLRLSGLPGYTCEWDKAAQKLKIFNTDRAAAAAQPGQEATGVNFSAFTNVELFVLGA